MRRDELSLYKECVLLGNRVVIPEKMQKDILKMLHSTHIGKQRMKALARSLVWWPKLDVDIQKMVRQCQKCAQFQSNPPKKPDSSMGARN